MRPRLGRDLPARSEAAALEVSAPSEEYRWLRLHPCLCGGEWRLECQELVRSEETEAGSRMTDRLEVHCEVCGRTETFWFAVQYEGKP